MTPLDDYTFFEPPGMFIPDHDEVHISCTFTWDKPKAEQLYESWYGKAPVKLGGPAYDDPGETFIPGMYIKPGITFTSRGCPNNCKFCFVPKREGKIRELPISSGNIIQDNNFLACTRNHREKVYQMLHQQKQISFKGGLETYRLSEWDIEQMRSLRISELWMACDTKGAIKTSVAAIEQLKKAGFTRSHIRCYVLIGDDMGENESRLEAIYNAGALPFAQLFQPEQPIKYNKEWRTFAKIWSRPAIYKNVMSKEVNKCS